ncbi:hypothetical protein ACTU45_04800 [Streptomyces sp. 24-1644]|uniref:hypothetical protein n=1 Tax=Streptomyces sp. 24-1644 TaxID=3457315 RepID=UPI003FA755D6
MTSADQILTLVRTALDEFDDRPLTVSVRRAVRIASLAGDSQVAVRLGMELRPSGGDPRANGEATRRLMADPALWASADGPAEAAMREYLSDRTLDRKNPESRIAGHSLSEIEYLLGVLEPELASDNASPGSFESAAMLRNVQELARHRTFAYLCEWERRFGYSSINDSIFGGYKAVVDRLLSVHAPDLVERFNTVYRRLNEAAAALSLACHTLPQAAATRTSQRPGSWSRSCVARRSQLPGNEPGLHVGVTTLCVRATSRSRRRSRFSSVRWH